MRLLGLFLLLFSKTLLAQTEVEAGLSSEHLSNNFAPWKSEYLEAAHTFAPRQVLYGSVRGTERVGLADSEVMAGYSHPLSASLTGTLEGAYSGEHHVLPESTVLGQLAWAAGRGWVLTGGLRHSRYTLSDANLLIGGVERYWDAFRAGYTLYNGHPQGAGSASAHRFTLDYYYGERSRVGLGFTYGREVENVGPPLNVVSTDVRALGVIGRHWLTPSWALTYEAMTHQQGNLYRRQGVRLGLRYRF